MPEKWTVGGIVSRTIGVTECWEVQLVRPDGTVGNHIMPISILEWRAAEYGIDPTDVDTLMEVILHEPHMAPADDTQHSVAAAEDGPDLWAADNTDTARAAHLARVKSCPVQIGVRGSKALAPIRARHRPDPDRIRAMREAVDTNRWMKKYGDLPARAADPMEVTVPDAPATSPRGRN